MVEVKVNLAHRGNYGDVRSLNDIKYIVIHYTGNDGDTDENNGNYFKNNDIDVSAHYFVDDDSITRSVPDNYVAWHCGSKKGYKHSTCRNANSIGIEICDDVKNGTIYPSAKTIQNAIELTKTLMKKYGIPASNVIRHYDVTGKICPAYWCNTTANNNKWKTEFWNKLSGSATSSTTATASNKLYRVQIGAFSKRENATAYMEKAKKAGFPAFITQSNNLYRVQIGAFSKKENAELQAAKAKKAGFTTLVTYS